MSNFRSRLADGGDFIVYLIYRMIGWVLGCLPLSWAFHLGRFGGWLGYYLLSGYRSLAMGNVKIAFPDWSYKEVKHCAKRHFEDLLANLLCSFVLLEKPWAEVRKHIDISELERAKERISGARSVIWAINHIGNWELFIFFAGLVHAGRHAVIYRALSNRFIDAHIRRGRGRTGLELIERQHGLAQSTHILKEGGVLGILVDQHAGDKGIWTPFFNRLASTTPLPAILATKTDAELLPVAIFTVGPGKWRVAVSEFVPKQGASVEELSYRINRALELLIIQRPSDWFWLHQRWKTPSPKFLLREYKRGVYVPKNSWRLAPFRVLVRSSNWLGDAVMSAPAVRRLKRGRPDIQIAVLARSKLADFWRLMPEIDQVITIDPGDSIFRVAAKIRGGFEVAVLFPNSVRSAIEPWLAGIPRRVGYSRPWRDYFVNQIVPEPSVLVPLQHEKGHYLRIMNRIGANLREPLEQENQRFGGPLRAGPEQQSEGLAEPLVAGLCPGAEYGPAKRWTGFDLAAKQLSERDGWHWLIFGTANEKLLAAEITKSLKTSATDLTGRTSLLELAVQIRRCRFLLTNDTGAMHLAAFLGIPTVAIFGSTEPRLTGPIGEGHVVIRHHVECSPCFLRECPLDFRCMKAVTADEVVSACRRVGAEMCRRNGVTA
ncbi:MAG: lipopolysaccharide heptosyltransferase II [Verrucomicrobia bacterium]|nr:lipopolysaccharide heptosyltransferase II [Verrucomicrobiota bacterium]